MPIKLNGSSSGYTQLSAPATAGNNTLTLPTGNGSSGQYMQTDGSGNLSFATIAATPGGSTTQLQYNNASAFGGISGVTTDGTRITASTTIGVGGATPSTSGSGITFPATFSNSTNANTLDDYEEGTFTFTGTGFTTTITGTAYYTKIGNQVTLRIPDIAAVSNTTLCTITGLPVELRASAAYTSYARVYNASTTYNGHFYGGHANTIEVYFDPAESAFTASGVKGIVNTVNFSYTLA